MSKRLLLQWPFLLIAMCSAIARGEEPPPPAPAADPLPVNSRWRGTDSGNDAHAGSKPQPCRLVITKRDGASFTGEFWMGRDGLRIEGQIAKDGTIRCLPTAVLKGDNWQKNILKDVWTGQVRGDTIRFARAVTGKGGDRTAELTRGEEEDKPKGGKGKDKKP